MKSPTELHRPLLLIASLAASLLATLPVSAAPADADPPSDLDALSLTAAPTEPVQAGTGLKLTLEGAAGLARQQSPSATKTLGRGSVDVFDSTRLTSDLRAVVSDRLDAVHPTDAGTDHVVNTLREAYVSWQRDEGASVVEFGRINLRYGPSYGYNPTDFFRDSSLRVITTADPLALRERRLGTVVLRGQHLWTGGSLAAVFSPKLANGPSSNGASIDLGATNNRNRELLVLSNQFAERFSTQLMLGKEDGRRLQVGASMTALVGEATIVHAEWSRARERSLVEQALMLPGSEVSRNRFVGGLTYSTSTKLSFTAEYEYNGFALNRSQSDALRSAPPQALGAYLVNTLQRQELGSRQAYFFYATQKNAGITNLDLTALMRIDAVDHSRLAWAELRYHWPVFDLALQLQQQSGSTNTDYGSIPYRRSGQLVASYFFK